MLQLRRFLTRHLRYPRRNQDYQLSQMILALVYPIILGLDRLETASLLRSNGTFQYLTGLPSYPIHKPCGDFCCRLLPDFREQLHRVNDYVLQHFIHRPDHRSRLILDLDSTVVTVFGHQEGAAVGYNPRYRGKRSYDPLLCLEANSSFLWDVELRRGDAGTWAGSEELLACCFHSIPSDIRELRVRADAGFGYGPVLEMLEARPAQYAVVARMTPSLKCALRGLRYERMNPRWEIAEFEHRPSRLVSSTPLHCGAEVDRGDRSGADFVYLGALRVSSLAHEPAADAGRRVAVLRRPRRNGATHPGAARGLCAAEDSDSCFCGQRPLSGSSSAGLQPRSRLFSGHVFARNGKA